VGANGSAQFAPTQPDLSLVQDAQRFLQRAYRPILPRKQWPARIGERGGKIPAAQQLLEGRALSLYGDAGWGQLVKDGKYRESGFDDTLIDAIADMLENHWQPDSTPTWVTAVPSRRAPELVRGFAKRLADRLGLPYRDALEKIADTPQQKTRENGYFQASNALDSFRAIPDAVVAEPVYLVDDMVDSRWSITVCGVLLAEAGSGPVVPLALSETTKGAQQ
jgi:ATP-dependent DNA helicase RecQ